MPRKLKQALDDSFTNISILGTYSYLKRIKPPSRKGKQSLHPTYFV